MWTSTSASHSSRKRRRAESVLPSVHGPAQVSDPSCLPLWPGAWDRYLPDHDEPTGSRREWLGGKLLSIFGWRRTSSTPRKLSVLCLLCGKTTEFKLRRSPTETASADAGTN